ncbi:MAG TPA: signal peptidase II [Solirubrobacterales bacterium]|jgi:signal peptidase II|nr:signal peptidase II [Solirubrobacterales bacterium]
MSATARAWCRAGALCGLVVGADQAAKAAIEAHLTAGEEIEVLGPLKLTLAHNSGVAFGLAGGAGLGLVLVTLLALAAVAFLFARDPTRPGIWVAAGLLAGGALGNLADRVRADAVTDFVDLSPWPAFNLADICITAGVVLLLVIYLRGGAQPPALCNPEGYKAQGDRGRDRQGGPRATRE